MKSFKILLALAAFALGVMFFLLNDAPTLKKQQNAVIVTSNFALYDVVQHVAADTFSVENILPLGVDPHSFEPTPKTLAKIENAKLFFYSGDMLEPWVGKFTLHVKRVDVSRYVRLLPFEGHEEENHEEEEHEAGHHHHGAYDPHYWLDIENMQKITHLVAKELTQLKPKYATLYEKNAQQYIQRLQDLEKKYDNALKMCKQDTLVVSHNAFGYLAKRYGFHVASLSGIATESHTNAKNLQHILQQVEQKGIQVVFFEDFSNHKEIETIANELSTVRIDKLQPLANITKEDILLHRDYIDLMEINLQKIKEALQCR